MPILNFLLYLPQFLISSKSAMKQWYGIHRYWIHHSSPWAVSQCQKSATSGIGPKCKYASTASAITIANLFNRQMRMHVDVLCERRKGCRHFTMILPSLWLFSETCFLLLEFLPLIFAVQIASSFFLFKKLVVRTPFSRVSKNILGIPNWKPHAEGVMYNYVSKTQF